MNGNEVPRPESFPLTIQGGMLEALGINMYTSLGKCLVEFVANAYDGEATEVRIRIPVDTIAQERDAVRAKAKAEVHSGDRDPFRTLLTPLPTSVKVTISDNGHGMSPDEIRSKFLPINRKRRLDGTGEETNLKSENGRRHVMGRKGLGKLAGFGAANEVQITTKRKDETYSTTIVMDFETIGSARDINTVQIPATYANELPADSQGTTITLTRLKADAVKHGLANIVQTLREAFFGIEPQEFSIYVNEELIRPEQPEFEFTYPPGSSSENLATDTLDIEDVGTIAIEYFVGIRRPGDNLPASRRGARIYCNGRLAAGPSLFGLPTGMHNFHTQSYLECIVRADDIDRHGIDFVNTNRTQLRSDNEVVRSLIAKVEEYMRKALVDHSKFRDEIAETAIEENPATKIYAKILDRMPAKARTAARRLLRTLAVQHGAGSPEFMELAPLVIDSMNAGDVLIRLSELGHDPQSIIRIADHLKELADIEKNDALKLYRGRRSGINALLKLVDAGEYELWRKKQIEKDLHILLKEEPWLIKPEYSRYLTSDLSLDTVASRLARVINVDGHAPPISAEGDDTRPDLVFVMADAATPHAINIVELKSPSQPLKIEHLNQLKTYMLKVERYIRDELGREVYVHGYLIGAMADSKTTNDSELLLRSEIERSGPEANWTVLGVRSLLERALQVHVDAIEAIRDELEEPEEERNVA